MGVIEHGKHITLQMREDIWPSITADDYELYDVLEDYIVEDCGFKIECIHYEETKERKYYTMEMESGISFGELVYIIKKYDLDEIERIYKVNNS